MQRVLFVYGVFFLGTIHAQTANARETLQEFYRAKAKQCETLPCIREAIDKLNTDILNLLVQRTAYVQRAGDLKLKSGVANDAKRVTDQLVILENLCAELGLPKEIAVETFKVLMNKSIEFEQHYIDEQRR